MVFWTHSFHHTPTYTFIAFIIRSVNSSVFHIICKVLPTSQFSIQRGLYRISLLFQYHQLVIQNELMLACDLFTFMKLIKLHLIPMSYKTIRIAVEIF